MRNRLTVLCLLVASCASPTPLIEPLVVPPLPADQPANLVDLLQRARLQATGANEAFYVDNWGSLEESARVLEETAKRMPGALNIPAERKAELETKSGELSKFAVQLREAAKAKDVDKANALMQQIHLTVRGLQATK